MRHVPLVPQRDVLEPGLEVAAKHVGKTTELLGAPRVALVRHGAGALLRARGERLLYLADLGALEMTYLEGERLDRRAERGARVEQLGVAVAGDHLRGRRGPKPELFTDVRLDLRVDVGVRADRAGDLADGDGLACVLEADAVVAELQGPERELAPERDRLRVDPVRAAGHRGAVVLTCPPGDRGLELVDLPENQIARVHRA